MKKREKYDGAEMDQVRSPLGKMLGLAAGLTALTFVYVYVWSFVLGS